MSFGAANTALKFVVVSRDWVMLFLCHTCNKQTNKQKIEVMKDDLTYKFSKHPPSILDGCWMVKTAKI